MANVGDGFNYKKDLITEREVVFNFISRIRIGQDWDDPQYGNIIFNAETSLKNILRNMAKTLPTSIYNNLDKVYTTYVEVPVGATEVSCTYYGIIVLAISERTGLDLTDAFVLTSLGNRVNDQNGNAVLESTATLTTDVPYTNTDVIRFYGIGTDSIK